MDKKDGNYFQGKTKVKIQKYKHKMQENYEKDLVEYNEIKAAKTKIIEFNSLVLGVSAVHPELNFENWSAPHGKNTQKPLWSFFNI